MNSNIGWTIFFIIEHFYHRSTLWYPMWHISLGHVYGWVHIHQHLKSESSTDNYHK